MKCPYCESGTNDFVPMNQAVEYSGIEMAVNRQGMLRVRVLDDDGSFTTQDIIEIRNCPLCGKLIYEGSMCMSGIVHCPRCGHHINIPSDGTVGYCPICDKEVTDMEKRTIWVKSHPALLQSLRWLFLSRQTEMMRSTSMNCWTEF